MRIFVCKLENKTICLLHPKFKLCPACQKWNSDIQLLAKNLFWKASNRLRLSFCHNGVKMKMYNGNNLDLIHKETQRKMWVCELVPIPATEVSNLLSRFNCLWQIFSIPQMNCATKVTVNHLPQNTCCMP